MTDGDAADLTRAVLAGVVTGVEPLKELVARLLTVVEQLTSRIEVLELETLHQRQTLPPASEGA